MPSFGEKLKQEREKRKITLEEISLSTKIGTRMLQALEENKFNQLPGGIFNKGFVRAYSRVVGLDEDQTVADYLQASGDAPPPRTEIRSREEEEAEEARENNHEHPAHPRGNAKAKANISRLEAATDAPSRPLPWGLFAAILLAIALALSLWNHYQRQRAKASRPAQSLAQPSPAAQSSSAVSSGAESSRGPSGVPKEAAKGLAKPALGATSPKLTSPSRPAASTAPKTLQDVAASAAPAPGQFAVVIQVREESWISATTDGHAAGGELMPAGSVRSIRGRKEIIVRVGNSGGVDFLLNGKKLQTGGEYGEAKTVTFGPQGILPNAEPAPGTP